MCMTGLACHYQPGKLHGAAYLCVECLAVLLSTNNAMNKIPHGFLSSFSEKKPILLCL